MKSAHRPRITFPAIVLLCAVIMSSCRGVPPASDEGGETAAVTETEVVTETEKIAIRDPDRRSPEMIYRDVIDKMDNALAYDAEDTFAITVTSEKTGDTTQTSESRRKYIAEAEDGLPMYSSTTTTVSETGSEAVMYAYGGGVGYHSIAGVSVKSECSYDEFEEFRDIASEGIPDLDIVDYKNLASEFAEDGSRTLTFSEPSEKVLEFFYSAMGFSETDIEGSSNEVSEGEMKISPEGYLVSERITFSAELIVFGEEVSVELLATTKVLSVDDPDEISLSLPTNTAAYTEIESLTGFAFVRYSVNRTLASGQASSDYKVNAGMTAFEYKVESEYLSSYNNMGAYTAEAVFKESKDGNEVGEFRYNFDGSTMFFSDGSNTYTEAYSESEAYHQLSTAVHFMALGPENFEEFVIDNSGLVTFVTCRYNEQNADYCAISLLQYLLNDENSNEDYYYILSSKRKQIDKAYVRMSFDTDGNLVGYMMEFDGVYTDSSGMNTAVSATIRVTDLKWY